MIKVLTTDISQLYMLEMLPDTFVGIQIRSIAWQLLQAYMLRPTSSHKLSHFLSMNRRAIPDHHQILSDLPSYMLEESHTVAAGKRSGTNQCIKLSAYGDAAHHRQVIITQQRF